MRTILMSIAIALSSCAVVPESDRSSVHSASTEQFRAILVELGDAWNQGDASRAADCFTVDAIYNDPPDKQIYRGRDSLFRFFGGESGRPGQMQMQCYHVAFNEASQVGLGEFTFTYGSTVHGVAVIRMRDGKISNWREYWHESPLPWERLIEQNPF